MTVIRPNSVSGINSITAQADEIKVFKSNGTQGGLIIGGANLNATTGISTILALNVTGNVSIAGTLTYQDVTNVDSLGIGTFRTGINVSGGQLDVGSNIKIGNAGVITATSFSGSGANLTGIDTDLVSDTSPQLGGNLDVNTKNIIFGDSSNGSSDDVLAFGAGTDLKIYHSGNQNYVSVVGDGNLNLTSATSVVIKTATSKDAVVCNSGGSTDLYHNNSKKIETTSSGLKVTAANSSSTAFQLYNTDSSANVWYVNGEGNSFQGHTYPRTDSNLDLGYHATNKWRDVVLSGGIRFGSANEVDYLDDYNEGVFQPYYDSTNSNLTFHGGTAANNSYYTSRSGSYVKIGKRVFFQISLSTNGLTVVGGTGQMRISGLPFTAAPNAFGVGSSTYPRAVISCMGGRFNSFTPNYLVVNQGTSNLQVREAFTTYGQAVGGTGGFDTSGSSNRNVIEAYGYYDVSN